MKKKGRYNLISLFSGAMGLDLGLERSGFETRVAVEIAKAAVATIKSNKPKLPVMTLLYKLSLLEKSLKRLDYQWGKRLL